jgi:flagellar hook assembly protein FlgD
MSLILRMLARLFPSTSRSVRSARLVARHPRGVAGLLLAGLAAALPAAGAVSGLQIDPAFFSPNGDGVRDSLHIRWSTDAPGDSFEVVIRRAVLNTETATVRRIGFVPGFVGAYAWDWDGRDELGQPVADGNYRVRIFEWSPAGVAVDTTTALAGLILDTVAPPEPSFDDGWDGRDTTVAQVVLEGTAPQADSVTIYVDGIPRIHTRVVAADSSFQVSIPLLEGPNAVAVQAFDRSGNRSAVSPAITLTYRNTADINFLLARPFVSSPNGDGVLDSVTANLRLDAATTRLLVQVRPANPPLLGVVVDSANWVRTLFDGAAAAGDHVFEWDGTDSTAAAVSDGFWYFTAKAESADVAGAPREVTRFSLARFELDRTAPPVPVPSALPPARTTRNFFVFTGRLLPPAKDTDSVLVWRDGEIVQRATDDNWSARVSLNLGVNTFTLQSIDLAGNRSAMSAPYTIVYEEPIGFHAPERFRASDVFDINLTRTGRSVRIDLHELDGRRVRTLLLVQAGSRYELPWNVRDDRGITVGDGPYIARLTVTYDDGVVETRSAAIVVAK